MRKTAAAAKQPAVRSAHPALWLAAGVLFVVLGAGLSAPLLSAHVIGFSPHEQHTGLQYAAPGAQDVSVDHPSYIADDKLFGGDAFDALDTDGDGKLRCTVGPGPVQPLHCPELDRFTATWRAWDLLIDVHDRDHDGALSVAEFPLSRTQLDKRLHVGLPPASKTPWHGPHSHARLDTNSDGKLSRVEIIAGTRATRFSARDLLKRFDEDADLAISKAEFPGLPRLRTFWLGADGKGRDLLSRLLFGARMSLLVGLLATAIAIVIGATWGAVAGYVGGQVDNLMMRIVDLLYGLPFMFIVILLLVVAGRSTVNLFIALGAVSWLNMARIVRGQVQSIRERDHVLGARAIGAHPVRILWLHILPATLGPIVVTATLMVPAVIIEEALLSFLGLGVQPPASSWGTLIAEGAGLMANQPWLIVHPAAMLGLTLLSLNFVGDGLRDRISRQ
jgi:ABC-type dipeptide/oligopeptide/nickel transport system permease subunit